MKIIEFISRPDCDAYMLDNESVIKAILPELYALKRAPGEGGGHKDNYSHTAGVLGNVIKTETDGANIPMRLIAILHDIGKATTKKFIDGKFTFHGHEEMSGKLTTAIFKRDNCGLTPDQQKMVITIIRLHGRPKAITEEGVTDSAIRRMMVDAGEYFYDLIQFCKCDATTKYEDRRRKYAREMDELLARAAKIHEEDEAAKWRPPFTGKDIMDILGIASSTRKSKGGGQKVGEIKDKIIAMIKSGELPEEREACLAYIRSLKQ